MFRLLILIFTSHTKKRELLDLYNVGKKLKLLMKAHNAVTHIGGYWWQIWEKDGQEGFYSSNSRPGMYSKLTSKTTGLFGATLGLPGAEVRPFGNANYDKNEEESMQLKNYNNNFILEFLV